MQFLKVGNDDCGKGVVFLSILSASVTNLNYLLEMAVTMSFD
jgi:hypothetical protein